MVLSESGSRISKLMSGEKVYSQLFSFLPVGIAVVDRDLRVIEANSQICETFGRDPVISKTERFGNAFNCAFASRDARQCGTCEECAACQLRSSLIKVLRSGSKTSEIEFNYHFVYNGRKTSKWFMMNAANVDLGSGEHAVVALTDISKRKRIESELIEIGVTDALTGLYNRRYIASQLESLLSRDSRDYPVCVAMIDVDNFKRVNDQFGHLAGDEVLQVLAEVLTSSLRDTDCIGRYGGDEFLIVLRKANLSNSRMVIGRIARRFADVMESILGLPITFSVGLFEIMDSDLENFETSSIVDKVDKLLYRAKAMGKNRIEVD